MARTAKNPTNRRAAACAGLACALRHALAYVIALALALPPAYLASLVAVTATATAATYADGNTLYQKGDFKGAERALRDTLRGKMTPAEQAKTLKLLGIC